MLVKVKAFPDAKKEKVDEKKNWLEIHTKQPAAKNMANKAIISILAKYFNVNANKIKMIKGARTKNKHFEIKNQQDLWK